MDATFINPVLSSMVNVLATMAQMEPKAGKPSLKQDDKALGVVTGVIAMEGPEAKGSLAISFPKPVILDITKRMLREEKAEVDDMVMDLTGELANMVLGGAKRLLEEQGYHFGLTLPSVKAGEGLPVEHPYKGPKILLPFTTDAGEFFVEICFEQ
jgi:chemotaxis protein CheX